MKKFQYVKLSKLYYISLSKLVNLEENTTFIDITV